MMLTLLLACTGPKPADAPADDSGAVDSHADDSAADDSAADDSAADDSAADDSAADDSAPPRDLDGDGHPEGEDCDDRDPAIHPGAEEVFNGYDDDCDGVRDADGRYAATVRVGAQATYEGQTYRFTLSCPAWLTRSLSDVDFEVSCTPDPEDPFAQLLLGATLTLRPQDGYHWSHTSWEGDVDVASSNGWDTPARGSLAWPTLDEARLEVALSAVYLQLTASGSFAPEG